MRFPESVFLFAAVAAAATTTKMRCDADYCLRAVRASDFPTRPGTADCSSYFRTTVTPATITFYESQTVFTTTEVVPLTTTTNVPLAERNEKRQATVAPSSIPAYASWCSGAVRYSSACSCIGVTAMTITAPAPSTTITETISLATTTTSVATATATNFLLQVDSGNYAGRYLVPKLETGNGFFDHMAMTTDINEAEIFTLRADGYLSCQKGTVYAYDGGQSANWIIVNYFSSNNMQCTLSVANILTCTAPNRTVFGIYASGYSVLMGQATTAWAAYSGEGPVVIKAIRIL